MSTAAPAWSIDPRLQRAELHARRGEVLQAELLYRALLREHGDCVPAARAVAALARDRGDVDMARALLVDAVRVAPADPGLLFDLARLQAQMGEVDAATSTTRDLLAIEPGHAVAWLMLAELRDAAGDAAGALRARWQAIDRAQRSGRWMNAATTEPELLQAVMQHIERLRTDLRDFLFQAFDAVRREAGPKAMRRVERALTGYLGDWDATPPNPHQRPKFLYFPDLPEGPYHDPMLHPWAPRLRDAFEDIRAEAMDLLAEDRDFVSFLGLKPGQKADGYVGGSNPQASWDAYFFYRRGERFDRHHERCPKTSAVLESVDLCRVTHQAPEVCFSVIRPQSTIMAHHGVTNTRLVMHLPLLVPRDCALNVIGEGEHHWKEGELMMFDDTFQHEAWNRSDEPRLIVLMDCWNPHLTEPEQRAVKLLVEAIDSIEN